MCTVRIRDSVQLSLKVAKNPAIPAIAAASGAGTSRGWNDCLSQVSNPGTVIQDTDV